MDEPWEWTGLARAGLLLALGTYFGSSYLSGNLNNYINPEYNWLVLLSAGLFGLLGLAQAARFVRGHAPEHSHAPAQAAWGRLAVLAVPLALGIFVPGQTLGASAAAGPSGKPPTAEPPGRTVVDWGRAFHYHGYPNSFYEGQAVDLIGVVVREGGLTAGQFAFARLVMRHCAADTYAVGLLVVAPGTDSIADGSWARVTGTLHVDLQPRDPVLEIRARDVDATIGPPEFPYIYPQNFVSFPGS